MNNHRFTPLVPGIAWQELPVKELLVAVALTGAKFTPAHHLATGDPVMDSILRGDFISVAPDELVREIKLLHEIGVRYFHVHARNPLTREQSCDESLYRQLGTALRSWNPEIILSYGASRNGREITDAIQQGSEWSRVVQAALSRAEGGADFVTIQAAAELKIVTDLERQGYIEYPDGDPSVFRLARELAGYVPGAQLEDLSIGAHSTAGGGNYGSSSALSQFEVFHRAMAERGRLGLPQEVEWTQLHRSYTLTKLAVEHFVPGLGNTGRLNVTILFGFSPLLPFPMTYGEFRHAVDLALSLKAGRQFPALDLTVSVGAAVLPKQAGGLTGPLDVGRRTGEIVGPLERLIAYACMPGSGVDVLRFGLEDAPFLLGASGEILPATNLEIGRLVCDKLAWHGGKAVTDPVKLRHFISTETRSPAIF